MKTNLRTAKEQQEIGKFIIYNYKIFKKNKLNIKIRKTLWDTCIFIYILEWFLQLDFI